MILDWIIERWSLLVAVTLLLIGSLSYSMVGVACLVAGLVVLLGNVLLKRTRRSAAESAIALLIGTAPFWRLIDA